MKKAFRCRLLTTRKEEPMAHPSSALELILGTISHAFCFCSCFHVCLILTFFFLSPTFYFNFYFVLCCSCPCCCCPCHRRCHCPALFKVHCNSFKSCPPLFCGGWAIIDNYCTRTCCILHKTGCRCFCDNAESCSLGTPTPTPTVHTLAKTITHHTEAK